MKTIAKSLLAIYLFLLLPFSASAFTIGAVSDLHSGKKGTSNVAGVFEETVKTMQKEEADVIIVAGDMIERKKNSYAAEIKDVSQKTDVPILWVKGNHDGKSFKIFSGGSNYYHDFDNWRIIVLDSNGGLSKKELSFLKKSLETDKNVVIAMHYPALKRNLKPSSSYKKFRKALTPNVRVVLSGHWHTSWKKFDNGILFQGIPELGKGNYKMIDL